MASRGKLTGDVKARKKQASRTASSPPLLLPSAFPSSDDDEESRHVNAIPNRDEARTSEGEMRAR